MSCSNTPNRRRTKQGAAVVELAVCLPLLVLISLATIEACGMIYLKQSLKIAAYESARVAIVPGAELSNVQAQCDLVLGNRNIRGYALATNPPDPATVRGGEFLQVSVTAPCLPNSLIGGWFYQDRSFTEAVEVMVE